MAQFWVSPLNAPALTADGSALTASTSLTDISPAPQVVLPANFLFAGQVLRVRAWGRFTSVSAATLLLGVYYGGVAGTAIATTGAITTANPTNQTWELDLTATVRSVGSSGTVLGAGHAFGMNAATNSVNMIPATAPVTATIDTTTAKAVTIGAQWGANNASSITCHLLTLEALC